MSADLFLTGLSGLSVARSALATTAHNTANVYTEGFSRQVAQVSAGSAIATRAGFVGAGAQVDTVTRSYDGYLNAQLASAGSSQAALDTYGTQIDRIDALLADNESGLSVLMQGFFSAVQGVANTPADPAARQQLLSSAESLSAKFRGVDQYLSALGDSVNGQLRASTGQINAYASRIANLNQQIGRLGALAGGQPPNDLLDQRDQLVSDLSQIVDVKVLQQDGGQYNVFIGNGQSLVVGQHAARMQAVASTADPTRLAVALTGVAGNVSELADSVITGGSLGGLLAFRAQSLAPAQNAIGRLSLALAGAFNAQHGLGVDLTGAAGGAFFGNAPPGVFSNARNAGDLVLAGRVTDAGQLGTSDYAVQVRDVAGTLGYTVTRLADDTTMGTFDGLPIRFDGVTLDAVGGGTAQDGDSFLVLPTRYGARDMQVLPTDPAQVAAASPVITGSVAGNLGSARIDSARIDSGYAATPLAADIELSYDAASGTLSGFPAGVSVTLERADGGTSTYAGGTPVPYAAGAPMHFDGITVSFSGAPAQGDRFTIARNVAGVSDGRNALLLGDLQRQAVVGGGTRTLNGAYSQLVSEVGNRALEVGVAATTQASVTGQIKASQQAISGVNQDEETANLLMYQQMYQANAKVIQTASILFDTVLGIRS